MPPIRVLGLSVFTACVLSVASEAHAQPAKATVHPSDFAEHLDRLVPQLLRKTNVPGAAVALVRHGEIVHIGTWGAADAATGVPVGLHTLFNVGSVAKPLTAWGVMRLVERGRIALDAPITDYLPELAVANPRGFDTHDITVRRLLSHTAGLSMPSVPGVPERSGPSTAAVALLRDSLHRVVLASEPGSEWRYSGGGYLVLQQLVEVVSGMPFDAYMRAEVLQPLQMHASRFGIDRDTRRATPYDSGAPAPVFEWPAAAAADLNTTIGDLALFVAASASASKAGASGSHAVLSRESVMQLVSPAPGTDRPYTLRYGMGHELWPLRDARFAAGHNGQNTGWSAAAWWVPASGDGIVVLTNDSHGMAVHRWIVCDWVSWSHASTFGGYCAGRRREPAGTLDTAPAVGDSAAARLRRWSDDRVRPGEPGGVLSVRQWGREIVTAPAGVADLESRAPITDDTPFYVASVAKPVTAGIVEHLVGTGRLHDNMQAGTLFPELPQLEQVTVRQLLDQTAGLPDYFQFIEWNRFRRLDDAGVIDTLARHPTLEHAPGSRFAYSNSNYVVLSELVRRRTGVPLREVFNALFAHPLALQHSWIADSANVHSAKHARGYSPDDATFRLNSYEAIDLPGPAPVVPLDFATTGAGGLYMSARDLVRWGEAQHERLSRLPADMALPVAAADSVSLTSSDARYRGGWYVSSFKGRTVYWHDGNRGGHGSMIVLVPSSGLTIAFVTNRSDLPVHLITRQALDVLLR